MRPSVVRVTREPRPFAPDFWSDTVCLAAHLGFLVGPAMASFNISQGASPAERLTLVVLREDTEEVYAGIEWKAGSPEADKLRAFIQNEFGKEIREGSAIGIKPMSAFGSKRLIDMAIRYALKHCLPSVTLMHK